MQEVYSLAIAAARAVLKHLKAYGSTLQEQLNQRTSQFIETLNAYSQEEELPIQTVHFGSLFGSASSETTSLEDSPSFSGLDLLYYHLLDRGIILRGDGGFLSTAHTEADIDYMVWAVKDSIEELREGGFLA